MERYTRIRALGKGNMGQANLVRHNTTGVTYVMKLVDMTKMNRRERQFAMNEAKLLASVKHPNVVDYVDSFTSRGGTQLCIVMEYCDGGDLFASIQARRGRPFPEQQVLDWFLQITCGMRSIAKAKLLHRDIKTANIFLNKAGVIKIGDFGVGRTLDHTYDVARTFVGTPYYLSPEIAAERPYSFASDMWSAGVVLYELLALRWPFQSNDMRGLMARIARAQYDPLPATASTGLREVVRRLLVVDPRRRPTPDTLLREPIFASRLAAYPGLAGGQQPLLPRDYVAALAKAGDIEGAGGDPDGPPPPGGEPPRAPAPRQRGASLPSTPIRNNGNLPPVDGPAPRGVSPHSRPAPPALGGGDPIARLAEIRAQFAALGRDGGRPGLPQMPAGAPQPRARARSQPITPSRQRNVSPPPGNYWGAPPQPPMFGGGMPPNVPRAGMPPNPNLPGIKAPPGVPGVPRHLLPGLGGAPRPSSRDAENRMPGGMPPPRRMSPHRVGAPMAPAPGLFGGMGGPPMGGGGMYPAPPGRLAAIR